MNQRTAPSALPRPIQRLMPIALAALLGACANLPSPTPTVGNAPVPAQWTAAAAQPGTRATELAAWWQRFDDARLSELVTQALQANTNVQAAQAALRQARAVADGQQAGRGPSIGSSASVQRSQSGNNSPGSRFQAGFDASWEPDIFGGKSSAASASEADVRASAASLANVQVSLAAEVATTTINLRSLQSRLAIAQSNLETQQETLQITRWRAQAGLVSSLDLEQAISSTEQTRAQIPALQTSVAQTLNALAVLTGQAPGALQAERERAAPIPQSPPDLALAFPAETLRQRPDIQAAEARAQAALDRLGVAEAARYPSFRLSGSLGLSSLTLGTLTNGASLLKSVLAGVSWPVFDGGASKAQVRAQQAALDQARANHQGAVLTALQDVEDALTAIQGDRERLARLQIAGTAASNAELLARQRYQSGLTDFSTVLNTQRTLLSAQDSVASAQARLSNDHVRLYKALGGGWQPDTQEPNVTDE